MDFLPTKGIEYVIVIGYLALLIPFWRLLAGRGEAVPAEAEAGAVARLPLLDMFRLPDGVMLHPGHAWAALDASGLVTVGMDDFARQLVGPLKEVAVPRLGANLVQGERAWTLKADSKTVDMLSPVSGVVVAVNHAEARAPHAAPDNPYDRWLLKIRSPRLDTDAKQLLADRTARPFLDASWEELSGMMTPELGTIMHDGGTPVNGFARGIDEEHWDIVARRFLRS
jgi:glycine cleavage system H protein